MRAKWQDGGGALFFWVVGCKQGIYSHVWKPESLSCYILKEKKKRRKKIRKGKQHVLLKKKTETRKGKHHVIFFKKQKQEKKKDKLDFIKIKNIHSVKNRHDMSHSGQCEDELEFRRKYLQNTHLIKNCYRKYTKNS